LLGLYLKNPLTGFENKKTTYQPAPPVGGKAKPLPEGRLVVAILYFHHRYYPGRHYIFKTPFHTYISLQIR